MTALAYIQLLMLHMYLHDVQVSHPGIVCRSVVICHVVLYNRYVKHLHYHFATA